MPTLTGSGKWQQVNIGTDCFMKEYEKGTMFRMPYGCDYSGFVFFHPNTLVKDSRRLTDLQSESWEQCKALLYTAEYKFELQRRLPSGETEKITLTPEQFTEQIKKGFEVPQYQDDRAYLQNCPGALRTEKKFIVERLMWDSSKGKFAKLPINPNKENAEAAHVNDASTWGTFEQACAALERHKLSGFRGGIGYVLTADTNIVGIDLDLDKTTHELTQQGKEILAMMKGKTYIEYSASGAVHILGFGSKPGNFCKGAIDSDIEMYGSTAGNRALMLTGKVYDGKAVPMANIQPQIDEIYKKYFERPEVKRTISAQRTSQSFLTEKEVVEHLQKANNSQKFQSLMAGDITAYGNDYNNADLALCSMIAYYTDDKSVIDSIYRQSALYSATKTNTITGRLESRAEKWDRPRTGGSYGEQTIALALSTRTGKYDINSKHPIQPLIVKKQTEKAVLVMVASSDAPTVKKAQWLPKSGIDLRQNNNGTTSVIAALPTLIADHSLPKPTPKSTSRR